MSSPRHYFISAIILSTGGKPALPYENTKPKVCLCLNVFHCKLPTY